MPKQAKAEPINIGIQPGVQKPGSRTISELEPADDVVEDSTQVQECASVFVCVMFWIGLDLAGT